MWNGREKVTSDSGIKKAMDSNSFFFNLKGKAYSFQKIIKNIYYIQVGLYPI